MVMIFILFALYFWLSPEMHYTIVQLSPINLSLGSNQIRQPLTFCCIEVQKCILIYARLCYESTYRQCIVELHFRINTYWSGMIWRYNDDKWLIITRQYVIRPILFSIYVLLKCCWKPNSLWLYLHGFRVVQMHLLFMVL